MESFSLSLSTFPCSFLFHSFIQIFCVLRISLLFIRFQKLLKLKSISNIISIVSQFSAYRQPSLFTDLVFAVLTTGGPRYLRFAIHGFAIHGFAIHGFAIHGFDCTH